MRRLFLSPFVAVILLLAGAISVGLAETAPAEKQKIEALIARVEGLTDAAFIRNGSEYSAANAARFLRGKWDRNKEEIQTAEDFIAKAGTLSSTSGKPYLIKLKSGKTVPCADYLHEELGKLKRQ